MKEQASTVKKTDRPVFDLREVGYTDLEGGRVRVNFDRKEFANLLFNSARSIEMDTFARAVHAEGRAELTEQAEAELLAEAPKIWVYRAAAAIRETIENLKTEQP